MMSSLQSTSSLEDLLIVGKIIHRRQMYDSGCFFHFDISIAIYYVETNEDVFLDSVHSCKRRKN